MVLSLRRVRAFRISFIDPNAVALIIWILPPPPFFLELRVSVTVRAELVVRSSVALFGWNFFSGQLLAVPLRRRRGFLTIALGLFGGRVVLLLAPVVVILRRDRWSRRDGGLRSPVGGFVIFGVARRGLVRRRGRRLHNWRSGVGFPPVFDRLANSIADSGRRRRGGRPNQGQRNGLRHLHAAALALRLAARAKRPLSVRPALLARIKRLRYFFFKPEGSSSPAPTGVGAGPITVSTFAAGSATGASPSFARASLRVRIPAPT